MTTRVAYLGPNGSFAGAAARALTAGRDVELVPAVSVQAALDAARDGSVDQALVPIENSVEGSVSVTLDELAAGRRLVIIDKPDAVQTEIRIGALAIPRKHPDYLAWDLAVKILGGEGANRLHQVLRSARGLTYGAEADTDARKDAGAYVAQTDTRTETTAEALKLAVDEFTRLQREKVGLRELGDAQAYLAGSFPLTIETPNAIATQILNNVFYELPLEEVGTFRERVLAITPEEIQRVSRAYIRPDRLSIVLVGNARQFLQKLAAFGFTNIEVIGVDQVDLLSPTLKKDTRR